MSYHVTIFTQDNTSRGSLHFTVRRWLFWGLLLFALVGPATLNYVLMFHIMPNYAVSRAKGMASALTGLRDGVSDLKAVNEKLEKELETVSTELDKEKKLRGELEARIAIAENARVSFANKAQGLEQEVVSLKESLSFYKEFLQPVDNINAVQCYNITAEYKKGSFKYGVSFLNSDQNASKAERYRVEIALMSGINAANMDEMRMPEADRTATISFQKSYTLTGTLNVNLPEDRLRIVNFKAYDTSKKLVGHCWKSF